MPQRPYSNGAQSSNVIQLWKRGLTRIEASALAGISPACFDQARAKGIYPNPTLPGKRYDRKALELAMDRLSGMNGGMAPDEESPLDAWRARNVRAA